MKRIEFKSIICDKFAVRKLRKMGFFLSIDALHRQHNEFTIKGELGCISLQGPK